MSKKQKSPYIKVKGISQYVQNFLKLKYTPLIFTPEGCFYEVAGERIPAEQYEEMYPILLEKVGADLDGRKNWY